MTEKPEKNKAPDLSSLPEGLNIPPPVAELIGLELSALEPGKAVFHLQVGRRHTNPMGILHGGVMCDLADAAMGMAFASTLNAGESFTTLELKINFLRAVRQARLKAVGVIVRRGRTVGLTSCEVSDEEGNLVAYATSTCMVLKRENN
jgi:uncharacterized protein (TIGR00369 family)